LHQLTGLDNQSTAETKPHRFFLFGIWPNPATNYPVISIDRIQYPVKIVILYIPNIEQVTQETS